MLKLTHLLRQWKYLILILLIATWFFNGLAKYLPKGIYNDNSQWDLKENIESIHVIIDSHPTNWNEQLTKTSLNLPVAFGLYELFGVLNWIQAKTLWLIISIITLCFIIYWIVKQAKEQSLSENRGSLLLMITLFVLFKGTYLGLAAGQLSLVVAGLLLMYIKLQSDKTILALICLSLAIIKPHLALPFIIYLIIKKQYRQLMWLIVFAVSTNLLMSIRYYHPLEHFKMFFTSLENFHDFAGNDYLLMGASGRTDITPLLAVFDLSNGIILLLLLLIGITGIGMLLYYRHHMSDQLLVFNLNMIFFTVLYHRDYDLVLYLALAIPFLINNNAKTKTGYIIALFPLALPIQGIYRLGMTSMPELFWLWNFIGTSAIIAVLTLGWITNLSCKTVPALVMDTE